MFSPYSMDQTCAWKGLAQLQAWHACDVSGSPEQAEACEEKCAHAASQAFERTHMLYNLVTHTHESVWRKRAAWCLSFGPIEKYHVFVSSTHAQDTER